MNTPVYLLIRADARQIPLRNKSVSLVIATPPYFGVRRLHKRGFCTSDADEHEALITQFLSEAMRIVKRHGYVLLISSRKPTAKSKGARYIVFHVLQKRISRGCWTHKQIRSEVFLTHYMHVTNFHWWALSIRLYQALVGRYSKPAETVAHIFSGSGNGAIAALELARRPVLIDLYYHRQTKRRLDKWIHSMRPKMVSPSSSHVFA